MVLYFNLFQYSLFFSEVLVLLRLRLNYLTDSIYNKHACEWFLDGHHLKKQCCFHRVSPGCKIETSCIHLMWVGVQLFVDFIYIYIH